MVQQQLLFDDRDKWRLIRGLRVEGLTKLENGRLRKVLEVLYVAISCSGGGTVMRRVEDLADHLDCSSRTARRWLHRAEDLKLIVVEEQVTVGGRGANIYAIDWDRVKRPNPPLNTCGGAPGQNVRAPSQNGRAPSQNGSAYKEQVPRSINNNPSSTSTLIGESTDTPPEWVVVEDELRMEGALTPEQTCEAARERGADPERVLALISHYRSRPGAWRIGFLVWRIEHDRPDLDPTSTWPDPAESPAARQATAERRSQARAQQMAAAQRAREAHAESRDHARDLEKRFGQALDELDSDQLEQLALGLRPDERAVYEANPKWARADLLELLSHQSQEAFTQGADDDFSSVHETYQAQFENHRLEDLAEIECEPDGWGHPVQGDGADRDRSRAPAPGQSAALG